MKGETISGRYHYRYDRDPSVYKITNLINGKVYIGSTFYPEKRYAEHRLSAHSHNKSSVTVQALSDAFHTYGWENFKFEIIERVPEVSTNGRWADILASRENYWIRHYISEKIPVYNAGYAVPIRIMNDHERMQLSQLMTGRTQSIETKQKRGNRVIAINIYTDEAVTADSAKQLGDYFVLSGQNNGQAAGKDIMKNKLKRHQLLFGEWYLFYLDKDKMKEELDHRGETLMYTKTEVYYSILEYLYLHDESEYSEKYNIHDTSYRNQDRQIEIRDNHYVIHSRNRGLTAEYNPAETMKGKYGFTLNRKDITNTNKF